MFVPNTSSGECRAVEVALGDEWRPQKRWVCPLLIFPHTSYLSLEEGLRRWGIQGGGAFRIPNHFNRCPVKASEVHGHIFIWSSLMNAIYVHFICHPTKYPAELFHKIQKYCIKQMCKSFKSTYPIPCFIITFRITITFIMLVCKLKNWETGLKNL